MSTKLIGALIFLFVVWGGYRIISNYKQVQQQRLEQREAASGANIDPGELDGVPHQLERSLQQAQAGGGDTLGRWLEIYGDQIRDPRKAWLQLEYCILLARDDPQRASEIYLEVKQRIRERSPVYPRLKSLEKSFE